MLALNFHNKNLNYLEIKHTKNNYEFPLSLKYVYKIVYD